MCAGRYHYRHVDDNVTDAEDSIDTEVNGPDGEKAAFDQTGTGVYTYHGVTNGNGDGTVPLISLGYMCVEGWQNKDLNPSGIPVTTIEYPNRPDTSVRGGRNTADHVDILGNYKLTMEVLQLVSGGELKTQIQSNIVNDAKKVKQRLEQCNAKV